MINYQTCWAKKTGSALWSNKMVDLCIRSIQAIYHSKIGMHLHQSANVKKGIQTSVFNVVDMLFSDYIHITAC